MRDVDQIIKRLLDEGRLRVDTDTGSVFATRSNTPNKPIGTLTRKGYLRACLTVDGQQVHVMVHRVVWIAEHGVPEPGLQIDHGRRGKTCNALSNLEAVPGVENMRRAAADGKFRHVGRRDGIRDHAGRFGKKAAGRLLDGRTHDEFPGEA